MNDIFILEGLCRISKLMTFRLRPFRQARALAGLMGTVCLIGCGDRDAAHVRLQARAPAGQGGTQLEITAQVAGPQTGLRYKWYSVFGGCDPQDSDRPTTTFKFGDGATRDSVSVELWREGKVVGRSSIDVKLDELRSQLAAQEQVPSDLGIAITTIPPFEPSGGPDTRAEISGTVEGKSAQSYSVVLYSRASEVWYIQPIAYASHAIRPDNTWTSWTHTGSSYAALLVRPGFELVPRLDVLPKVGGYVLARTLVDGKK